MFIRSERLFLRPRWPEDWAELLPLLGDEGVVRNLAKVPWPYTAKDAQAFVRSEQPARLPTFFVTLPGKDGTRLIGSAGLGETDGRVELGYWIARPYWGRGYATEAARAVLKLAKTLGHRRVSAHHFVDNPASGRVLAKVGFRPLGRIEQRFSAGRGQKAPALAYVAELGEPCDCDGMRNALKQAA